MGVRVCTCVCVCVCVCVGGCMWVCMCVLTIINITKDREQVAKVGGRGKVNYAGISLRIIGVYKHDKHLRIMLVI